MGSRDNVDWLPGLGNPSHGGQSSVPAPPDMEVDEVQYSIVCDDCGRHFWSRSKADSHAALTAHVLHEANVSPSSHVTVPHSPAINLACAPEVNMYFASAIEAEASPNSKNPDLEDRGDSGDEEYSPCFDCDKHFWSHEAGTDHAKTGHLQDTEMVTSSAPDGSPTSSAANLGHITKLSTLDWAYYWSAIGTWISQAALSVSCFQFWRR